MYHERNNTGNIILWSHVTLNKKVFIQRVNTDESSRTQMPVLWRWDSRKQPDSLNLWFSLYVILQPLKQHSTVEFFPAKPKHTHLMETYSGKLRKKSVFLEKTPVHLLGIDWSIFWAESMQRWPIPLNYSPCPSYETSFSGRQNAM